MATSVEIVPADEICPTHGTHEELMQRPDYWRHRCADCSRAWEIQTQRKERERKLLVRLDRSGLIGWTQRATFESYVTKLPAQKTALKVCQRFVAKSEKRGETPWLLGPPGTGKTHLGSAMVNHVIREREQSAAIHSAREIVRMLRAAWNRKDEELTESEVLDKFATLSLLVIDEVGVGFGSDSELVQLFDVIDLRYRLERPTALISNFATTELKPVLGDAAFDRLRQGARVVPMNWPSHRGSLT